MKTWTFDDRLRLSEKYKHIAYIPLDIPKIEPDDWSTFISIWDERKDRYYKQRPDSRAKQKAQGSNKGEWLGLEMWEDPAPEQRVWTCPYVPEIKQTNPVMSKMIQDLFPFDDIWTVKFMRSTEVVGIHQEGKIDPFLFPKEFRIMLFDQNPKPTFFLTPIANRLTADQHTDIQQAKATGEKLYMSPPLENNSFVFNNETCYHGSDYDPAYSKVLISIRGQLNLDKYEDLMDRSILKFNSHKIKVVPSDE